MGQNIKDFKSWQRVNEESFLGWIGGLASSAFTGNPAPAAPATSTTPAPTGSASADSSVVGSIINKTADALGISSGDKKKEGSSDKDSATPSKFKKFDKKIPAENVSALEAAMDRHGITNEFARKAILGVVSKESSSLAPEIDYHTTPNDRIREVYGQRVADLSDDELTLLKNNPTKFWDRVYGVDDPTGRGIRYGNTQPGDGEKYRGRGFNQLTFKSNYKNLQDVFNKIGKLKSAGDIDIVKEPELLEDPDIAAEFAILYFIDSFKSKGKNLNAYNSLEHAVEDYVQANAGWGKDIHAGHTARGLDRALSYAKSIA